ncbi:multidrug effflux MFS transporter [Vibrio sp. SS-MA-C1-2]|uniref:multidrug effflux MFS transporter n=1 Tax=Vibrio sp. SS-MA-C1-2 TaxID=2908646 RepID=UPI001F2C15EC|nr:multidrug effflux MFS transporter [Vibrio sp. SS-MA-C1-2]UJF19368.1 multidrug effflux MFS transporter [Vibrio sp. SS-MA-C1-2]
MNTTQSPSSKLIILMIMLVLFSPLAIDIYLPALPMMAESYQVDLTNIQDTVTLFIFSLGLGQLFAGPLADRYGRRPIALIGAVIYAASALLAWWAKSLDLMLFARLIQGFGACCTSVAAFSAVRDSFGPERSGRMISYLNGAICFIPALAPLLGGWLSFHFGWRSNFSFMFGYGVIAGVLLMIFFSETRPTSTQSQGKLISLDRYLVVLKSPVFLFHASLCMLGMAVILSYVTAAPSFLIVNLGLDMQQFSIWFGINAVINIVGCLLAPRYIDKFGSRNALTVGLVLVLIAGALMFIFREVNTPLAFMGPIFITSVSFALIMGASAGRALAPFGDCAGTAAALLGLFQMSGSGLLVGITQRFGLTDSLLLTAQMWLLLPGLIILWSKSGQRWHPQSVISS